MLIPQKILQLSWLDILDISKNRIRTLPEEISNLTSLKVLAVSKNKIERLPLSLGSLTTLRSLKIDGNPLVFPPPEICTIRPDIDAPSNENDRVVFITTQIKRYLRSKNSRKLLHIDSDEESR